MKDSEGYRYDKRKKVEDSTKGKSYVSPRTYKRDVLMQVWLQSRHLATLLKWFDSEGVMTRFRSELIAKTIEQVVEHLVEEGIVEMVEFADDAIKMLDSRFGVTNNPSGRGGKNTFHNLTLDEKRREGSVGSYDPESRWTPDKQDERGSSATVSQTQDDRPVTLSKKEKAEASRIYKEFEAKQRGELAKEEFKRVLGDMEVDGEGVVVPANPKPDCASGPVYEEDMEAYEERERKRTRLDNIDKEKKKIDKEEEKIFSEEVKLKAQMDREEDLPDEEKESE